jgi:mannosyl-3-phosphoglycerate synthase
MLIEMPRHTEIFGSLKIHEMQRVLKIDSGGFDNPRAKDISFDKIKDVLKRLALVIPVKDENINLLDGVLRAIPFDCSIIVVSNSKRETKWKKTW